MLQPLNWAGFFRLHPFAPVEQTKGYRELLTELNRWLCEITGHQAFSLQPNRSFRGLLSLFLFFSCFGFVLIFCAGLFSICNGLLVSFCLQWSYWGVCGPSCDPEVFPSQRERVREMSASFRPLPMGPIQPVLTWLGCRLRL